MRGPNELLTLALLHLWPAMNKSCIDFISLAVLLIKFFMFTDLIIDRKGRVILHLNQNVVSYPVLHDIYRLLLHHLDDSSFEVLL